MEKGSNYLFAVVLLSGSLLSSGLTLSVLHNEFLYSFFFGLAIFLAFLGIVKILNSFAHFFPFPIKQAIFWLHAMVFETLAIIFIFFLKVFHPGKKEKLCGPKGRPILLIHGYVQNGSNWIFFKPMLCNRNLGPVYTIDLKPHFGSILEHADLVKKKAEEIARESGRSDLILIGHSMGGLVSALYATKFASPNTVTDVITIGSPIGGTHAAIIALGSNGREMRRGSEFSKMLQELIAKNEQIRFFHIGSRRDQIILPASSAWTGNNPEREFTVEDLGHMSLLFSCRIADKIHDWLSLSN